MAILYGTDPSSEEGEKGIGFPQLVTIEDAAAGSYCCFDADEDKTRTIGAHESVSTGEHDSCIGSSIGWLVVLDKNAIPYLLNPFSQARIDLPPIFGLCKQQLAIPKSYFGEEVRKVFFKKAILLSDPSTSKKCVVVAIYDYHYHGKIGFCNGKDREWTTIDGTWVKYVDIICHNNMVYAVTEDQTVEAWDFQGHVPIRRLSISPSPDSSMAQAKLRFGKDLFSWNYYLVESSEKLLLVVRYIGNHVTSQGKVVHGWDLGDEDSIPTICPYRTLFFDVYELDFNQAKWIQVESLGDRILFLGRSHSLSISAKNFPGCEGDSIHFTDDNWDQMDEEEDYGGHDLGVFSLQHGSVMLHVKHNFPKFASPKFWITPNM